MSLRGPVIKPYDEARRSAFYKPVNGLNGSKKFQLNFFKHVGIFTLYIILVYKKKFVTNILMGLKILCQVGVGGAQFRNYPIYVSF